MQIQTRNIGENQVIISTHDFQNLIELARKVEPIEVETGDANVSGADLMKLSETSGALDFLHDEREDVYTIDDLKVRYK